MEKHKRNLLLYAPLLPGVIRMKLIRSRKDAAGRAAWKELVLVTPDKDAPSKQPHMRSNWSLVALGFRFEANRVRFTYPTDKEKLGKIGTMSHYSIHREDSPDQAAAMLLFVLLDWLRVQLDRLDQPVVAVPLLKKEYALGYDQGGWPRVFRKFISFLR